MKVQNSYNEKTATSGVLYLVGTPIGNLDDMTFRAIQILQEADFIAAEDTRQTIKLLNHYHIQKKLWSYHEHNKESVGQKILSELENGAKVALVSDAGMPAISDPGYELVRDTAEKNIAVIPIPGANAAISGLVASGLPTGRFVFVGFLPRDKKRLKKELEQLKEYQETILLYEAPHRIEQTLNLLFEVFGNRRLVMVRELTKKHEEFIRGSIGEILSHIAQFPVKGEITLVIEGKIESVEEKENWWDSFSVEQHVQFYMDQGKTVKESIKQAAIDRQLSKREVYQIYHQI